ncbi:MAG: hypothetical protein IPH07_07320 [Deltaproteobacteria bacterium]|nr:hypothetical protein [Deltaproteobacteria bacterium]MBK8717829.1 hypothetical protein [Deltaproteobacteria bacterium]MBP7287809.1 hypothetical protein [Nannocystaceae bacterium]
MIDRRLEHALDAWAAAAFGDDDGAARLQPWLSRWAEEVGAPRGDDDDAEAWVRTRCDWALVEMGAGQGCPRDDHDDALRRRLGGSHVGLFEVWPTEQGKAWLRDRVAGIAMQLDAVVDLRPEARGPAALWELRVVVEGARLLAVRPPLSYPLELVAVLDELRPPAETPPPADGGAALLQALRHARLWHGRAGRIDPRPGFAAAIRRVAP